MEGGELVCWMGVIFFWGWRWLWAERQWCLVIWPTIPFNPRTLMCPPLSTASLFCLFVSPLKRLSFLPPPENAKQRGNETKFLPVVTTEPQTGKQSKISLIFYCHEWSWQYYILFIHMIFFCNCLLIHRIWNIWWNKMHSWTTKRSSEFIISKLHKCGLLVMMCLHLYQRSCCLHRVFGKHNGAATLLGQSNTIVPFLFAQGMWSKTFYSANWTHM